MKRDKRNIGKTVRIIGHKDFDGRLGKITGFRGDDSLGNPWVNVYVFSVDSIWPFQGSHLKEVKDK